jgi:monoamine oxidase
MDRGSVVIIGGGVSGLAAGTTLLKAGFNEVTILEAEQRLGGRIHTLPFGNTTPLQLPKHLVTFHLQQKISINSIYFTQLKHR